MTGRSTRLDNVEYFRARAQQERIAAARARSSEARERHDELATMYDLRVAALLEAPNMQTARLAPERRPETA